MVYSGSGPVNFFEIILNSSSSFFFDRSEFIKEFLTENPQEPKVTIISAPAKFGKSTIVDMLKQFLSIPVDKWGNRLPVDKSANYRMFCKKRKKMKICKDTAFVQKHFGQYPVIHINANDYSFTFKNKTEFYEVLFEMISATFLQHLYLKHDKVLFKLATVHDYFLRYCSRIGVRRMSMKSLKRAFEWLITLLHEHFKAKIIILLDEFDSFGRDLFFSKVKEMRCKKFKRCPPETIIRLLEKYSRGLLNNRHIHKILMTGIIRVSEVGFIPFKYKCGYSFVKARQYVRTTYREIPTRKFSSKYKPRRNISKRKLNSPKNLTTKTKRKLIFTTPPDITFKYYKWLGNHRFATYFAVTNPEMKHILKQRIPQRNKRNEIMRTLAMYYGIHFMHTTRPGYKTLYNMWSVIKFFENNMKLKNYWSREIGMEKIEKFLFRTRKFVHAIKLLIVDRDRVQGNISGPLNVLKMLYLKTGVTNTSTRITTQGPQQGTSVITARAYKNCKLLKRQPENLDPLFALLFDLGLIIKTIPRTKGGIYNFQIPNTEAYMELCQSLCRLYIETYNFNLTKMEYLHSAVGSFSHNESNALAYRAFYIAFRSLIQTSTHRPKKKFDFLLLLTIMLGSEFPTGKRVKNFVIPSKAKKIGYIPEILRNTVKDNLQMLGKKKRSVQGSVYANKVDLVLIKPELKFVFEIKWRVAGSKEDLRKMAIDALAMVFIISNRAMRYPIRRSRRLTMNKEVYIGIAVDARNMNLKMAFYSPSIKEDPVIVENVF